MDEVEWAPVHPMFGSNLPYGSCNAYVLNEMVCGFPRRADGSCGNGHPAPPGWGEEEEEG